MGTDTRNGLDEETVQWDHVRSLGGASPAAFSGDEQHKLTSLLNLFPMPGPLNGHFGEDWTAEKRRYSSLRGSAPSRRRWASTCSVAHRNGRTLCVQSSYTCAL